MTTLKGLRDDVHRRTLAIAQERPGTGPGWRWAGVGAGGGAGPVAVAGVAGRSGPAR